MRKGCHKIKPEKWDGGESIELSTCESMVKEFGFYRKDNKEPVKSFQQRSDME